MANNLTVNIPSALGDILGVGEYELEAETFELAPNEGVLTRGSVLSSDAVSGKLVLAAAGNELAAFGILLEPGVDTANAFYGGVVTGSVARSGSFKGPALTVTAGTDVVKLAAQLRLLGIYVDGPIPNA